MTRAIGRRSRSWWPALIVVGVLAVTFPFWFLLLAQGQYSLAPACYGRTQRFESGSHLGFTVGMKREAAMEAAMRQGALKPGARFGVFNPEAETSGSPLYYFPSGADELRRLRLDQERWSFKRGPSWCLLSYRNTGLIFHAGTLVRIEDSLAYDGP